MNWHTFGCLIHILSFYAANPRKFIILKEAQEGHGVEEWLVVLVILEILLIYNLVNFQDFIHVICSFLFFVFCMIVFF